jgi:hypothetical protein
MPTVIKVFVARWLVAYDIIQREENTYGTSDYLLFQGGYNWWWGNVDLSRSASRVPLVYNFTYKFKRWAKSTLRNYEWQTGVNSDDTGWYFDQSNNALRQMIYANQTYNPDDTNYNKERVQAYNNETWYHEFEIINLTGITYEIEFNGNGGTSSSKVNNLSINYTEAKTFPASNTYTRSGYTFSQWQLRNNNGTTINNYNAGTSYSWVQEHAGSNKTAYAIWTTNTYTITYDGNTGTGTTSSTSALYTDQIYVAANGFTKLNFAFSGWGTDTINVNTSYPPNSSITTPSTNITLYAIWVRTYTVTFSSTLNGTTTIIKTETRNSGTIYGIAPNELPVINNTVTNIFKGWLLNNYIVSSFTLSANTTLIAKWDTNTSISFSNIQSTFGGISPIYISEYYLFSGYVNLPGGNGIPTYGMISASHFIGKYKSAYVVSPGLAIISGNGKANMDETNGNDIKMINNPTSLLANGDNQDRKGNIGKIDFSFKWFGTEYGGTTATPANPLNSSSSIVWRTNSALTFGDDSNTFTYQSTWPANFVRGVILGRYADIVPLLAKEFNTYKVDNYNIKRFIIKQRYYYDDIIEGEPANMEFEIKLITGPQKQYIEIRIGNYKTILQDEIETYSQWVISDKTNFYDVFATMPKTNDPSGLGYQAYTSFILEGTLNGNTWSLLNNNYMASDIIRNIGNNLVLRLDGYNINGNNNIGLTSGLTKLSSWYNSGYSSFTTNTVGSSLNPKYITNGVEFASNNGMRSDLNFLIYPQMNIFAVCKITALPTTTLTLWMDINADRRLVINSSLSIIINVGIGPQYTIPNYTVPINTVIIINCEYDSVGQPGNFYINNELLLSFTSLSQSGAPSSSTYIGYNGSGNSFIGIIYEIIIINRLLTDTERRNTYNILKTKWG